VSFLLLGLDSLIACIAISPLVSRKLWVPLALLFGFADGIGSLVGEIFQLQVPEEVSGTVTTVALVLLGIYLIAIAFVTSRMQQKVPAGWTIWVVPWILTIDNITYHAIDGDSTGSLFGQAFGQDAWSSALLALIGLLVGAAIARAIPALVRVMPGQKVSVAGTIGVSGHTATTGVSSHVVTTGVAGVALIVAAGVLFAFG
jgi:hypothetical protein